MNEMRPVGQPAADVMCEKRPSDCATMVGPNFRIGKKIGCGNFGELRLGEFNFLLCCDLAIQ